ncbi:MAG: DNA-directed RNA polymerase subunit alpha [Planctomycetes bacterium]|nr:DNA-directed RNA polymerase subunit alpha [Planctomycetota bacterium]
MRIRWREFELPTRVEVDRPTLTPTYGRFTAEPFERGFGTTVGNSLRRVLLSSIEGTAVTSLRIEGVQHEFSSIPGVVEDVTDIILNVKQLLVRLHSDEPQRIRIDKAGKGVVTAADIIHDATVEVVNPELHVATLADDGRLQMEMEVRKGRGYVTAEEHMRGEQEIGLIPVDSIYSPVLRVKYHTENTRIGQLTNYDKLLLEVWTDGTVTPEMAMVEAGKILRKHLSPFVAYFETGSQFVPDEARDAEERRGAKEKRELMEKLARPISDLDLSVRASNCIEAEGIRTVGELCARTETSMLKVRNFGKTSLKEIKKKLSDLGLSLGMEVHLEEVTRQA